MRLAIVQTTPTQNGGGISVITRTMPVRSFLVFAATLVAFATFADAAPTAAGKCAASKVKGSAKAVSSRTKCDSKGLSRGEATDPSCVTGADGALATAFSNAEAKGGCEPTSGQADDAQAAIDACLDGFVAAITGDGSCAAAKMKAVGKSTSSQLKCWQKGFLSGADADGACLTKATLKFGPAIEKADARGTCSGTAPALAALVDSCVASLLAPGTTTTTVPETTTTTLPETTTSTTSTTITTTTTETTTTTLIDIGPVGWTFCAHAGETCTLPRHDLPISFKGVPPATPYVTAIDGLSVECSAEALFPGVIGVAGQSGDCYYLNAGCDYETPPFGVAVLIAEGFDWASTVDLPSVQDPDRSCIVEDECRFAEAISADLVNELSVFVVDPRVCDSDDRARLNYRWTVRYPPGANNNQAIFIPRGMSGWYERTLKFDYQTMPTLDGIGGLRQWFTAMRVVQEPHADFPLTTSEVHTWHYMSFRYADAAASIAMATTCQLQTTPGPPCQIDNLLRNTDVTY
jgi:hypothetical protein